MRGLRKNPYRNREILEQIVAVVAVLAARRLDAHGQIPAELVLLAYLGLEPDGARSGGTILEEGGATFATAANPRMSTVHGSLRALRPSWD